MRKDVLSSIVLIVSRTCTAERLMSEAPARAGSTALVTLLLLLAIGLLVGGCGAASGDSSRTYHSELEYFKAVTEAGPVGDHQIIALLLIQYVNANQLKDGIGFFESLLAGPASQRSSQERALYLASLGALRASYADRVFLLRRSGWVNQTIDLMEEAKQMSNNQNFLVRWLTGTVYAQLPERFGKTNAARDDLLWCVDNIAQAPHLGWLREVYYYLGLLAHRNKNENEARSYLKLSGYADFDKTIILTTPYAISAEEGLAFHPKRLREIIPGRIFNLSGFEMTEYYFVVSDDGKQLISIDAGTRPDSARAAHEYLRSQRPDLPPLTTVLVTHAHWDHVGGQHYFRQLQPAVKFYARDNYERQLAIDQRTDSRASAFFGERFSMGLIADFKPDVLVSGRMQTTIGDTRVELIPISGGETVDGMFIYLPDHSVLFAGDFTMPYIGAPAVEEGNVPGLFDAIDLVVALNPQHVLHGHETLTRLWHSSTLLAHLKIQLEWLYQETLKSIAEGADRASIHHKNLIPPSMRQHPETQLPYLVMRENLINRVYDQHAGYWQLDLQGMDHLSQAELGSLLTRYLDLSDTQLARAIEKMLNSGDHELALRTASWALAQNPSSEALKAVHRRAGLKLKEKHQELSPFKFVVYSDVIHHETPMLPVTP
jgi:glyoxylase-like metal-dependent hydrolase (beta-lactamase superfamily II)